MTAIAPKLQYIHGSSELSHLTTALPSCSAPTRFDSFFALPDQADIVLELHAAPTWKAQVPLLEALRPSYDPSTFTAYLDELRHAQLLSRRAYRVLVGPGRMPLTGGV